MNSEQVEQQYREGVHAREDVFVDAGLCELGAFTTMSVQYLPALYLALRQWDAEGECGEMGALTREVAMRFVQYQMGDVQREHVDTLVRIEEQWEQLREEARG